MKSERFTKNSPNYRIFQKNVKLGLGSDECYLKLNRRHSRIQRLLTPKKSKKQFLMKISIRDISLGKDSKKKIPTIQNVNTAIFIRH